MSTRPSIPTRAPRLAVSPLEPGELELDQSSSHYLRDVLRLPHDTTVTLFDGAGKEASARIVDINQERVLLEVSELRLQAPPSLNLTVAVAPPKGERADIIVEKLTELGVSTIVWVRCDRSVVLPKPGSQKFERWQRIATSAARQSGRAHIPQILGPVSFEESLTTTAEHRLIGHFGGPPIAQWAQAAQSLTSATLVIGPEGGFTHEELEQSQEHGYTIVTLGQYTLRTETAAIAGAAVLLGAA